MQNVWFDRFTEVIPELKLRFFKKKHTFCTGENIIRFGSTLDAQIGVLTEKSHTTANGKRKWVTSCDSKRLFVSDNFHTFAEVTFCLTHHL